MIEKRMSSVAIILLGWKERSVYFRINRCRLDIGPFVRVALRAVHRRTREYRVAGSECNEYHRPPIHLAQARRARPVSPSAPPSNPLSPRESRRRRRTRSTKTSRVSGAGSTDSRTVLQSAGELACRAFARPLTFLPLSLSSLCLFFSSSAHRCIRRVLATYRRVRNVEDVPPPIRRPADPRRGHPTRSRTEGVFVPREMRKPPSGPSWGGSWILTGERAPFAG